MDQGFNPGFEPGFSGGDQSYGGMEMPNMCDFQYTGGSAIGGGSDVLGGGCDVLGGGDYDVSGGTPGGDVEANIGESGEAGEYIGEDTVSIEDEEDEDDADKVKMPKTKKIKMKQAKQFKNALATPNKGPKPVKKTLATNGAAISGRAAIQKAPVTFKRMYPDAQNYTRPAPVVSQPKQSEENTSCCCYIKLLLMLLSIFGVIAGVLAFIFLVFAKGPDDV